MNRIVEELKKVKVFYIATVDDNRPRVRPFSSIAEYENHPYLCTGKQKEIYKQLKKNNKIELSGMYDGGSWLRVEAEVEEDNRIEVQKAVLDDPTGPSQLYKPGDGRFVTFRLVNIKAYKYNFYAAPEEIKEEEDNSSLKIDLLKKIIKYLLDENKYKVEMPSSYEGLKRLHKALVNIREPNPIDENILSLEDQYLQLELKDKEIVDVNDLKEKENNIILWKGDITTLKCDVIVNAGNMYGLGCFNPHHYCIDNVIHTNAGMRLRLACNDILKGGYIKNGEFIICDAYNLPSKKVITTVGPQVDNEVTLQDEIDLSNCYKNCLEYAIKNNFKSIAFPSISTGAFEYPINKAKYIAYNSIKELLNKYNTDIKVVIDVFSESDYEEYESLFKD